MFNVAKYAIILTLDTDTLSKVYTENSIASAYTDIEEILRSYGFYRKQCGVYFGDERVDAVKAVIAVQKLSKKYDWFYSSVQNIRMIRIEEENDLMAAIRFAYLESNK